MTTKEVKEILGTMGFNVDVKELGDKFVITGDTKGIEDVLESMFGEYARIGKQYFIENK